MDTPHILETITESLTQKENDRFENVLNSSTPLSQISTFKSELDNEYNSWTTEKLSKVSANKMEELISDLYIKKGYISDTTQNTRDGGVDVIAEKNDSGSIWIEVKHWSMNTFGKPEFRTFYGAVMTPEVHINGIPPEEREIDEMHIVSTCGFSKGAEEKASEVEQNESNLDVKLLGPSELIYLLNKYDIDPKDYIKDD